MATDEFTDLEEFVEQVKLKALELGKKAETKDGCFLDIEFQPFDDGDHKECLVFRYLPPDRADLREENAKLKAEIEKLKGANSNDEEENKKRKKK